MSFDSIDRIIDGDKSNQKPPKTPQSSINQEYLDDFLIEAKEHLESIEMNILVLEKDVDNIEMIDSIFRDFHTIKGLAGFVSQNLVQKIAHQTESLLDKCRKSELTIDKNLIQLILKSTDNIKNICDNLDLNEEQDFIKNVSTHLYQLENFESSKSIMNDLKNSDSSVEDSQLINETKNDMEFDFFESILETDFESANFDEKTSLNSPKKLISIEENIYVRIPMRKIDTLVDMIGELVINHSQFEQQAQTLLNTNDKLSTNLHRVSTLTKNIQDLSMSLRMVSLKSVFQRIYRVGKDTISTLDKNTEISLCGEETEIDRGVVEKLIDPLIHLIKNSIYHGIESEAERIKNGKPPVGQVTISAYSKKGKVYIAVTDDGRGIDTQKVLQKAIKKKFVDPLIEYTNEDILEFVFLPGLSTLDKADNISGRGVGLDVVKTQIAKLGGKIEIKNTPGMGCSFIMKMPINMAIMNGMIVEIAGTHYIIPTLSIQNIIRPDKEQWVAVKGKKNMIKIRDEIISLIDIGDVLDIENYNIYDSMLIVLESNQKLKALPVDKIVEKRDVVVKSLGVDFDNLSYAFGASILGNGKIAVILNIESFFKKVSD